MEVDESRIQRRLETRYLDKATTRLKKQSSWQPMREQCTRGDLDWPAGEMPLMFCREWCTRDLRLTLLQIRRARTIQCGDTFRLPELTRI